mgnify:CR=1 FL=1
MSTGRARLFALAAAVLFSTGGAAIKTEAFSAAQVSCIRSGIAAVALALWTANRSGSRLAQSWSERRLLAAVAVAYATVLTLFVVTTRLTTTANAIFLQSTAPLYMVGLSPWLLGERIRRRDAFYMVALAAG